MLKKQQESLTPMWEILANLKNPPEIEPSDGCPPWLKNQFEIFVWKVFDSVKEGISNSLEKKEK